MLRASSLALAGVVVLGSGTAVAQHQRAPAATAANAAEALSAFNRGVVQYDHHEFSEALASFRSSFRLVPSPNSRLYVARCLRETGDLSSSASEFQATVDEAGQRAVRESRYAATRDAARGELRDLIAHAGHLRIEAAALPDGAQLVVGGRDVPRESLSHLLLTAPGRVTVAIQASGYQPFVTSVDVAAGAELAVPITLARAVAAPVPPRVARSNSRPGRGGLQLNPMPRNLAMVGAGIAILGAAGFVAFGVAANGAYADLVQRCGSTACTDPVDRSIASTGRAYDTLANVSLGVGIAGLVAGTALLVWSVRTGTRHDVALGTDGTSLTCRGRF